MDRAALIDAAKAVLDHNWLGRCTRPGPHLYPHQWSWDSAFVAIGLAHVDEERARTELRSLFEGQWRNGMLPSIVFRGGGDGYFPGPDVWETESSPDAPRDPRTSGIVQPPLHATAALRVHEAGRDRDASLAFLGELYPRLVAWHGYLGRDRDRHGRGLAALRHPWESGMDDSPAWDHVLARIRLRPPRAPQYRRVDLTMAKADERPTAPYYDRYTALVECFKAQRYDESAMAARCRFAAEDPLFNALLAQAADDLAAIAEALGEDPAPHREQAARTRAAVNELLWDEELGRYAAYDLGHEHGLEAPVVAGFCPLFAGVPDADRAARLVEELDGPGFWPAPGEGFPVPTQDRLSPGFARHRYWRGPVWANVNWMLVRGLERYGYEAQAERLRAATLELVAGAGFREYFDPIDGEGLGSDEFSWTAAVVLDLLLARPRRPVAAARIA